jgi:lysine 2,3-aminomutase
MEDLIQLSNPHDPIKQQFIPGIEELNIKNEEMDDPIGDDKHSPVKGIVHRYPDRCLFMPIAICPVYCRFCFRREKVSRSSEKLSEEDFQNAYQYMENHPEIWEVILTGGDPLLLKPKTLKKIMTRISDIPHVDVIRIHTRVPVVASELIHSQMIEALKCSKTVYIILHANHPNEFTTAAIHAISTIIDAGIPMLSQSVLLKNINDNIETLSTLMRLFIKNRIKPYYLHHADLVKGTSHFRTSIAEGQKLMKEMRGKFSGLCQPTYVLDIPGGYGKIPIGPQYIHGNASQYCVEDYCGNRHAYP